jgi:hypothetical protein
MAKLQPTLKMTFARESQKGGEARLGPLPFPPQMLFSMHFVKSTHYKMTFRSLIVEEQKGITQQTAGRQCNIWERAIRSPERAKQSAELSTDQKRRRRMQSKDGKPTPPSCSRYSVLPSSDNLLSSSAVTPKRGVIEAADPAGARDKSARALSRS